MHGSHAFNKVQLILQFRNLCLSTNRMSAEKFTYFHPRTISYICQTKQPESLNYEILIHSSTPFAGCLMQPHAGEKDLCCH
jgi:hypothetical protein